MFFFFFVLFLFFPIFSFWQLMINHIAPESLGDPRLPLSDFPCFFQLLKSRNRSQEAIFLDHKLPKFKINHTLTHAHAKQTNTSCTRSFA